MPDLEVSIFNQKLKLSYEEDEKQRLLKAVATLNNNWNNFSYLHGKVSDLKIATLISLELQDSIGDIQELKDINEIRVKVFLNRDSDLSVPSLYKLFKGSDWQERETYDMYGINYTDHPNPKRLLMPEDWRGWPLRKDYIQPDFYELQDAY